MERALFNGKEIFATEISDDIFENEEVFRRASQEKQLFCPDPECENKILRYCHGEKKKAYFAHLNKSNCDYADFDKNNDEERIAICRKLYESFKSMGFNIKQEIKIIPRHYTYLYIEEKNLAVEIIRQNANVENIKRLIKRYEENKIKVCWIVADKDNGISKINDLYRVKKFLLEETEKNSFVLVEPINFSVYQYKKWSSELYSEKSNIEDLIIEDNAVTIKGFQERFVEWNIEKRSSKIDTQKKYTNYFNQGTKSTKYSPDNRYGDYKTKHSRPESSYTSAIKDDSKFENLDESKRKQIIEKINIKEEPARINGIRWVKCEKCGRIAQDYEFASYGGIDRVNINFGICNKCR